MRMILILIASAAAVLGLLAATTEFAVRRIERAHPAAGRLVAVDGGRLHLLELGPAGAPAVVLLHGASGNLEDMRVALGDRLAQRYRVILVDRPGHGWSDRPNGSADASPARQAALIHQALGRIGVTRAIVVGHSWSGALATAYALAYPEAVVGLVLFAPVTHPWPGGVAWYNPILTAPVIGPLFARTLALPLGQLLIGPGVVSVFAPQPAPADYRDRAAVELLLRASEFIANAEDINGLKAFVTAQAPKYPSLQAPTIVITADIDKVVSPRIHSEAIAAVLPHGKLIVLPGMGHMLHHAAAGVVGAAIDEIAGSAFAPPAN
jgi:pimeloyl-ACP methyl ester carboxylesterase